MTDKCYYFLVGLVSGVLSMFLLMLVGGITRSGIAKEIHTDAVNRGHATWVVNTNILDRYGAPTMKFQWIDKK